MIDFSEWSTSFVEIILEGLPFILIGAVASAIIQLFTTEDMIKKVIPKNKFIAIIIASLAGLFMPICECAIIPITKSLIRKRVPIGIAIIFMLSVPIVNPIVILSTFYAFNDLKIVIIRLIGGIVTAILVGLIVESISKNKNILISRNTYGDLCDCGCMATDYFKKKSKLRLCIEHANKEFINIFKYYIFGAFLSSGFITIISKDMLNELGSRKILSIIIMMALAFLLSLCSEADAFIAKGFLEHFNIPAISAFLILGPMMDLKNAIIVGSYFKKSFTFKLIVTILIVVIAMTLSFYLIA